MQVFPLLLLQVPSGIPAPDSRRGPARDHGTEGTGPAEQPRAWLQSARAG